MRYLLWIDVVVYGNGYYDVSCVLTDSAYIVLKQITVPLQDASGPNPDVSVINLVNDCLSVYDELVLVCISKIAYQISKAYFPNVMKRIIGEPIVIQNNVYNTIDSIRQLVSI